MSQTIEIDRPLLRSLLVLASVIEARDPFTGGHIWRTSRYAGLLAEEAGLSAGEVFLAAVGGLVHDLGKVGVPDAVLTKRGRLTEAELAIVRKHPEIGGSIVADHPLAPVVEGAVRMHHLRADGGGYPESLAGRLPSRVGRVVSIADAFDAMTSFRPYKGLGTAAPALEAIAAEAGGQFDRDLARVFVDLGRRGAFDHVLGHASEERLMLACPDCGPVIAPRRTAADGDTIVCPACTGQYTLHLARDTFELEWRGRRLGFVHPEPDTGAIDEALARAPRRVELEG